jgi:hypothetical protein
MKYIQSLFKRRALVELTDSAKVFPGIHFVLARLDRVISIIPSDELLSMRICFDVYNK